MIFVSERKKDKNDFPECKERKVKFMEIFWAI